MPLKSTSLTDQPSTATSWLPAYSKGAILWAAQVEVVRPYVSCPGAVRESEQLRCRRLSPVRALGACWFTLAPFCRSRPRSVVRKQDVDECRAADGRAAGRDPARP